MCNGGRAKLCQFDAYTHTRGGKGGREVCGGPKGWGEEKEEEGLCVPKEFKAGPRRTRENGRGSHVREIVTAPSLCVSVSA